MRVLKPCDPNPDNGSAKQAPWSGSDFFYAQRTSSLRHWMYNVLFFTVLCFGMAAFRCSVKQPAGPSDGTPFLSELAVADTLYLASLDAHPLSVKVTDADGWDDIQNVLAVIRAEADPQIVGTDTLYDNGMESDIIPRDGVFTTQLDPVCFAGTAGRYTIGVFAEDASDLASDTLFTAVVLTPGEVNLPPELGAPTCPDTLTEADLADVVLTLTVGDPQGLDDLIRVVSDVFPPLSTTPLFRLDLTDNGAQGDTLAGDGVFTFRGDLSESLTIGGLHTFRFEAVDHSGARSLAALAQVHVQRENGPPVLSDLVCPDTVATSAVNQFLITIRVTDPQGLRDIKRVWFDLFKPDGTPTASNPVPLFDDGSNGDQAEGDGVFTLQVSISPNNDKGVYRFEFHAEDLSGLMAQPLIHRMRVMD